MIYGMIWFKTRYSSNGFTLLLLEMVIRFDVTPVDEVIFYMYSVLFA